MVSLIFSNTLNAQDTIERVSDSSEKSSQSHTEWDDKISAARELISNALFNHSIEMTDSHAAPLILPMLIDFSMIQESLLAPEDNVLPKIPVSEDQKIQTTSFEKVASKLEKSENGIGFDTGTAIKPVVGSKEQSSRIRVRLTFYSGQDDQWGDRVAWNQVARAKKGRTVAADPTIFPYGTWLHIPGFGDMRVEDTGSAVKARVASQGRDPVIDVYVAEESEVNRLSSSLPEYVEIMRLTKK